MDYDLLAVGTFSMENRDFMVQNMIAYLKVAQNTPYVNTDKLIKKIGVEGFSFPADDPIFPTDEEIKANMQKMMELQQMGLQAGEGRPTAKAQNAPATGAAASAKGTSFAANSARGPFHAPSRPQPAPTPCPMLPERRPRQMSSPRPGRCAKLGRLRGKQIMLTTAVPCKHYQTCLCKTPPLAPEP